MPRWRFPVDRRPACPSVAPDSQQYSANGKAMLRLPRPSQRRCVAIWPAALRRSWHSWFQTKRVLLTAAAAEGKAGKHGRKDLQRPPCQSEQDGMIVVVRIVEKALRILKQPVLSAEEAVFQARTPT